MENVNLDLVKVENALLDRVKTEASAHIDHLRAAKERNTQPGHHKAALAETIHIDRLKEQAAVDLIGQTEMDPTEIGSGEENGVDRQG